jgi:beta-mannosidase
VLVAALDDVRTVHTWVEEIDLRLDAAPFHTEVEAVDGGYVVAVTASSLVRDLVLHVDRLDPAARVDAALVTLPAGETVRLRVHSSVPGLEHALVQAPVLRTANDLVAAHAGVAG